LPFIFVDRVQELCRLRKIVAVRQLTTAEEIFQQHFPGNPMLPASLVIEACAQAATILLEASHEFRQKAVVVFVDKAKFRRPVRPGHELVITLTVEQNGDDGALLRGDARQRGNRCAGVELGMMMAPIGEFFSPVQLPYYLDMHRRWLAETQLDGFARHPLAGVGHAGA